MHRRVRTAIFAAAFVGSLGLVAGSPPGSAEEGEVGSSQPQPALAAGTRSMLGLPAQPDGPTEWVGSVPMTAAERSLYERYVRLTSGISRIDAPWRKSDGIVDLSLSGGIVTPTLNVLVSAGTDPAVARELVARDLDPALPLVTKSAPVTKAERNALWGSLATEQGALDRGRATAGLLSHLREVTGVEPIGLRLPGDDWRIDVVIPVGSLATATLNAQAKGAQATVEGRYMIVRTDNASTQSIRLIEGERPTAAISRLDTEASVVRGGKRMSNGCSTGAVVRSDSGHDYILTAGHCTPSGGNFTIGSAPVNAITWCDRNCPDASYFGLTGIDISLLDFDQSSVSGSGWFVHQAWGYWSNGQQYQGPSYLDLVYGAFDPVSGTEMVCVEGASDSKYAGWQGVDARSSCGTANGWSGDGYYDIAMYPENPVCLGDSGALVRRPGGTGGSYVAGTLYSIGGGEDINNAHVCYRSINGGALTHSYLTTFWKTHLYLYYAMGIQVWPKTW